MIPRSARTFLLLLVCATALRAQAPDRAVFSGRVVDSTSSEPLVGAVVQLLDAGTGDFTDIEGRFSIEGLSPGSHTVAVRYIGYEEKRFTVLLRTNVRMTITLSPSAVELPEVDVTGDRERALERASARPVEILSPSELDRHRGQTLGETLEHLPGVTVLQTGPSISKPVIRGLHSQRVRIFTGGLALEGQQWGGEHAPEIDPFAADRIEVLRGAAGVEYGAGAIGGVVRIDPGALRYNAGMSGRLSLNGFANNRQGAGSLQLEGSQGWLPQLAWRLRASYRRAGDARTSAYVIGNSGFEEIDGSATLGYRDGPLSVEAFYSRFGTELGIYRGSHVGNYDDLLRAITLGRPPVQYEFSYDIRAPKQVIAHDTWSARAAYRLETVGELSLQLGRQRNHRREYDVHKRWFDTTSSESRPAFDLSLVTTSGDAKLRHALADGMLGTLGVGAMEQTNVGNSLSFLIPNFRTRSMGVFLHESWSGDPFMLEAGARWESFSTRVYPYAPKNITDETRTFSSASVALGGTYSPSGMWTFGFSASSAWRPPTVNELYSNGVHHGTAQYEIGDRTLAAERMLSMDMTVKYFGEGSHAEIGLYHSWMSEFISLFPDPQPTLTLRGMFPTFRHRQDDARLFGIDGTLETQVNHFARTSVTFSIVRGVLTDGGAALYQMPADRVRIANHFHLPSLGFLDEPYIEIALVLVDRQRRFPAGADYLDPPPGYALLEAGIGADVPLAGRHAHIDLSVRNLLDAAYRDYLSRFRYYIDEPGRDSILRISIPFGDADER